MGNRALQVTMFEFRGKRNECLCIDDNWSEQSLIGFFKDSGWNLPAENITSTWVITQSNVDLEFPKGRKISMRLNLVNKLPKTEPVVKYIQEVCKAEKIKTID